MTARLPTPGGDTNNWGTVLNEFLNVAHTSSGQVKFTQSGTGALERTLDSRIQEVISVKDFGAVGDGATDDATAIQAAVDAANTAGGGYVMIPNGTFIVGTAIILKSNVYLVGQGSSTIKLKNSANTSVIEGLNFQTLTTTNTSSGISNFGIYNLHIDGNKTNNTSPSATRGHGIAFYGRDFWIHQVTISNTYRRGLHSEYGDGSVGTSPFNGNVSRLVTNTTGEEGWYNKVSDTHADNINVRSAGVNTENTYDAIYLDSSGGIRGSNINVWTGGGSNHHRNSLVILADATTIVGCHLETGATNNLKLSANACSLFALATYNVSGNTNILIKGNRNIIEGVSFPGSINANAVALVIGESGDTPQMNFVRLTTTGHVGGIADFTNSSGYNTVEILGFQSSGSVLIGTPQATDRPYIRLSGLSGYSAILGGKTTGAIAIGEGSSASGTDALAIGRSCTSTGTASYAIGNSATASQGNAHAFGNNVVASDFNTFASGGRSRAALFGMRAHSSGQFATQGDAQHTELQWFGTTSDATPTEIFLNGSSVRAVLPSNNTWAFEVVVVGRQVSGSGRFHHRYVGLISKDTTAGSTALDVAITETSVNTPSGWAAALTADTTNGALKITVTGATSTNIRWVAWMQAAQVQG